MITERQFPVLVLNADCRPLRLFPLPVMNWRKAVKKVMLDKVTTIAEYDAVVGRSAIKIPSVVMLKNYVRVPRHVPFTRTNIWLRDKGKCVYCGVGLSTAEITFDHVIPRSRGGDTSFTNISSACVDCNARKADRLPEQAGMIPTPYPYEPTQLELARSAARIGRNLPTPQDWKDFIYWDGELDG
jgi:5-methylcytosine-specific restriction endonuclease McrA